MVAQRKPRTTKSRAVPVAPGHVERAVARILGQYDDPEREGLLETPTRVARMYAELLTPKPFTFTTFDAEGADQMVVVRDVPFYTLCEHHLVPFYGHATMAYIPGRKIAGLSKLARTVDWYARRLQTQERLTNQIAAYLEEHLEPQGVGVVLQATHLCMAMRGVQKVGAVTVTSALTGLFKTDPKARGEFLELAYLSQPGVK